MSAFTHKDDCKVAVSGESGSLKEDEEDRVLPEWYEIKCKRNVFAELASSWQERKKKEKRINLDFNYKEQNSKGQLDLRRCAASTLFVTFP